MTHVDFRQISLVVLLFLTTTSLFAREKDSTNVDNAFNGYVTVTNKGISTIPNFTLGKPAAILNMSIGRKIRFEPEFRFALEGKPWMFIFWWRCNLAKSERFYLRLGANPTFAYKHLSLMSNGIKNDYLVSYRTLTADLTPVYALSKGISIAAYYMYVYGIEDFTTRNTHYLALRGYFSNIHLSDQFFLKFNPQFYYLYQDKLQGTYFNATLSLNKRNFPFALASLVSKPIRTEIPVGKEFLWNASVIYYFNSVYRRK